MVRIKNITPLENLVKSGVDSINATWTIMSVLADVINRSKFFEIKNEHGVEVGLVVCDDTNPREKWSQPTCVYINKNTIKYDNEGERSIVTDWSIARSYVEDNSEHKTFRIIVTDCKLFEAIQSNKNEIERVFANNKVEFVSPQIAEDEKKKEALKKLLKEKRVNCNDPGIDENYEIPVVVDSDQILETKEIKPGDIDFIIKYMPGVGMSVVRVIQVLSYPAKNLNTGDINVTVWDPIEKRTWIMIPESYGVGKMYDRHTGKWIYPRGERAYIVPNNALMREKYLNKQEIEPSFEKALEQQEKFKMSDNFFLKVKTI